MSRNSSNAPVLDEVEVTDVDPNELEDNSVVTDQEKAGQGEADPSKNSAPKAPKRGELPEGFVTPTGLAKVLTERGLHRTRDGKPGEVKPQMVYSYIKNASKEDPHPAVQEMQDKNGVTRKVVNLDESIAWWERKAAKAEARKTAAAEKAAKSEKAAGEENAEGLNQVEDADQGQAVEVE
jgi:hypothetical protein